MIDNKIIQQLNSANPEQRKQAIKILARSKDPAALKYLATLVKTDKDPEVIDLARKAAAYIKKSSPAPEPVSADSRLMGDAEKKPEADVYPVDDDSEPLPEEIIVSAADIARGQMYVEQALNWHIQENNDKAAQALTKAFKANPKLRSDGYTSSLASTITGLTAAEALKLLAPSAADLRKRAARSKAKAGKAADAAATPSSSIHRLLVILVLVGAAALIIGYVTMPWVDLSSLPTTGPDGQTTTVDEVITQTREQMDALIALTGEEPTPEIKKLIDAFNGLNFKITGLDTTLVTVGLRNIIDVMGLRTFFEMLTEMMGALGGTELDLSAGQQASENVLDYTLLFIPLVIVFIPVIGVMLFLRGGFSVPLWVFAIILGVVGMVPFGWFYTDISADILGENADLGAFGQVTITSANQVIGIGFWIALVGQLAILFLPFVALMVSNGQKEEAVEEAAADRLV